MKYFIYLSMILGLTMSPMGTGFSKDKGHGKQHGGGHHKAVQVKHDHPGKGNYFKPVKVHEARPARVKYVSTGKPRFYSPYYIYSPWYSPAPGAVVSRSLFAPTPRVLVSPTIFTPAVVEPSVPTYYFFPPLYVPPRSLFSLNLGL